MECAKVWRDLCHLREKNEDTRGGEVIFSDGPLPVVENILFDIPVYGDHTDSLLATMRQITEDSLEKLQASRAARNLGPHMGAFPFPKNPPRGRPGTSRSNPGQLVGRP